MNKSSFLAWLFLLNLAPTFVSVAEQPIESVTTIFPLYDWLRIVGGDHIRVRQLLPPGVEAHSYAPRPSDIHALQKADLFVFLHETMEPWAADLMAGAARPGLHTFKAAENLAVPEEHEGHHDADPHVWLDPLLAAQIVQRLAETLAAIEPLHAEYFQSRAAEYISQLVSFDERVRKELSSCRQRTVFYAGHSAFSYFAKRYDLTIQSPFNDFAPSAAPGPQKLAQFLNALKESGASVVFHEELVDPRLARAIALETGARLEMLHSAHNLTADERRSALSYLDLMNSNLAKLKGALDCP